MSYIPEISWATIITDVEMVDAVSYYVTVEPINPNEPGGASGDKEIGFCIADFVGYTFEITELNIAGNWNRVKVIDSFGTGYGPQSGQFARVYKTVGNGEAPYIAPIDYTILNSSAFQYKHAIELDILWKNLNNRQTNEKLIGIVDGINKIFKTSKKFLTNNIIIYLNGIKESHFIESGEDEITLEDAPKNIGFTDVVEAVYTKNNF